MTTGSSSHTHKVVIGGKTYTVASVGHTHSESPDPDAAAIAALTARVAALEKPPIVVPPPPPPPVTPPPAPGPLTPSGPLVVTSTGVIEGKAFTGTGGYGIHVRGTKANPIRNLIIRRCTFKGFRAGIWAESVYDFTFEDCIVDDVMYAGIMVLNGVSGIIRRNIVRRVGIGAPPTPDGAVNAYGISLNHDGSLPVSVDILVEGNTVEDVPTWEALDTHGGNEITFKDNIVRRSRRGVMITTGPGGSRPTDCKVIGNQFLSPVSVPVGDQYAVVPVNTTRLTVTGNTITGWGQGRDLYPPDRYPNISLVYGPNTVTP